MNRSVYVLGLALVAFSTSVLQADPVDPVFSMGDPAGGTQETSTTFKFNADGRGGGVFSFVNDSTVLWQNLQITVTEPSSSIITIISGPFFNAQQYSSLPSPMPGFSIFTIGLSNAGPTTEGGIPNGTPFTINLNDLVNNQQPPDPNGIGGWGDGTVFSAAANVVPGAQGTVPEPGSLFLLVSGLGLVFFGTRRLSSSAR